MNEDDEAAALAHQEELEHQQWEEELNNDPEFQQWLDMMNGLALTTEQHTQE